MLECEVKFEFDIVPLTPHGGAAHGLKHDPFCVECESLANLVMV